MRLTSLSLVFPAYNEAANLPKLLKAATEAAGKITADFEIIVVNDGSRDNTKALVEAAANKDSRVRLLDNPTNLGYGQTVWNGLEAATKDWVFFSDADLQFDLNEIGRLSVHTNDFDVIVGYRAPRRDPFIRLINAKAWNVLVRILFGLKIKDLDCAFKLFRRRVLGEIEVQSGGATFSAELMARLQQKGLAFKEVPVTHLPRVAGNPTGAKPAVIIRAFKELFGLYHTGELTRSVLADMIKFALVGLLSTIIDILLLNFFYHLGLTVFWAIGWAYLIGAVNGYWLNNRWTYRRLKRRPGVAGLAEYISISFVGLGLTELIVGLLVHYGFNLNFDKIVAVVLVFLWNFFGNRLVTFRPAAVSANAE